MDLQEFLYFFVKSLLLCLLMWKVCFIRFGQFQKIVLDNQGDFDGEIIDIVNCNFYVDVCLKFVLSIEKAVRLFGQLRELLSRGGFRFIKWCSNDRNLIVIILVIERERRSLLIWIWKIFTWNVRWVYVGIWRWTFLSFGLRIK